MFHVLKFYDKNGSEIWDLIIPSFIYLTTLIIHKRVANSIQNPNIKIRAKVVCNINFEIKWKKFNLNHIILMLNY